MARSPGTLVLPLLLALVATSAAAAPPPPKPGPVAVRPVRGGVYEVTGGAINNTGFVIGEKAVLVIDAKMTKEATRAAVAQIKKLTPKPVSFVVLTHSDHDHVGGLAGYPATAQVIAHANARRDLMAPPPKTPRAVAPVPRAMLPSRTFTTEMSLPLAGVTVRLLHFGPAHTDGDVVVFLPQEKVAFVGDLVFLGRDPLVHRHKRGSSAGLVTTLRALLRLDADLFLNGHGRPATRAALEELIRWIEERQSKVRELVAQKRSLAEVKKAFGIEDEPPPKSGWRWPSFVETLYRELTEPN